MKYNITIFTSDWSELTRTKISYEILEEFQSDLLNQKFLSFVSDDSEVEYFINVDHIIWMEITDWHEETPDEKSDYTLFRIIIIIFVALFLLFFQEIWDFFYSLFN